MGGPIRVLHVVVNMNRGGAETLIMNLYRNIDRSKVQFDFLTCKEGVFDKEILELGGRIHRIPYITDVGHFGYVKALNHFFKEHYSYKIVHSHMDKMSGLVLRSASKAGIPVRIAHSHSTKSEGNLPSIIYKSLIGSGIFRYATNFLACSYAAGKWLFSKKKEAITIINNGIESEKFVFSLKTREKVRKELNISSDCFLLGHVGRFSKPKNHTFLVDLFSTFNTIHQNSKLVLVGDGPLKGDIERKVSELKLNNKVIFLGNRPDINRLLQAFDLLVFPSLYEGLPVTLIEAQGAGLKCVISDNITTEVDLGIGLIEYLPITKKAMWIDKLDELKIKVKPRINSTEYLIKNGYDIKDSAKKTQELYVKMGAAV
ncbi:glycosyltransferase family 1 protein [Bacillus timonensis]|uniref:glycosyltransferase family 1 protein n=1 Tax=Bacillus timonensis TaxID=1033734 RepID=UPI000288CCBD|nr:glycosyltransferase family 1 protein [Bacillus timonensis]